MRVIVTVEEDHHSVFDEVIRACRDRGLDVQQELGLLGLAIGSIEASCLSALRGVEGVKDVEEEQDVSVGPPDSDIQ